MTDTLVYLVESPSPENLYSDIRESDLIARAVRLNEIACVTRTVVNWQQFVRAVAVGFGEAVTSHGDPFAFMHISAHGNSNGITLTDGTTVPWTTLAEAL